MLCERDQDAEEFVFAFDQLKIFRNRSYHIRIPANWEEFKILFYSLINHESRFYVNLTIHD